MGRSIASYGRRNWISITTVLFVFASWEAIARVVPKSPLQDSPMVPPWEYVFGRALVGLSDYWKWDILAPVPEQGGRQTLLGAILTLGLHSGLTISRVVAGFILGALIGTLLGLAASWSRRVTLMIAGPLHFLRMCPLLAMIPLFQFWFGATNTTAVVYVAYGVGVAFVAGTINAAANVPRHLVEYASTLGLSKLKIYALVIVPRMLPELFATAYLSVGIAWAAVIGAEFIGVDSGLGRIVIWANYFSNTGRMVLVACVIIALAGASIRLLALLQRRVLRWMPPTHAHLA